MITTNQFKCLYLGALAGVSVLLSVIHILTGGSSVVIPILTAALVAAFGVVAFLFRKKLYLKPTRFSLSDTFSSSAIGFLFLTVLAASLYFKTAHPDFLDYAEDANQIVSAFVKLLAAASALYFLLSASWIDLQTHFGLHLGLSFAPILFFAARILNEFINSSTNPLVNSRGFLMFSLIFLMLFFLTESKAMVIQSDPFLYLLFGAGVVIPTAIYDISNLYNYLGGEVPTINAIYSVLSLALAIHVIVRIAGLPPVLAESEELLLRGEELIVDQDVVFVKPEFSPAETAENSSDITE